MRPLPIWAEQIKTQYLSGAASQFLIHGNVFDLTFFDGKLYTLREFLYKSLLEVKKTVIFYNHSEGFSFPLPMMSKNFWTSLSQTRKSRAEANEALILMEHFIRKLNQNAAVIIDYVDKLVPSGLGTAFLNLTDRINCTTLQRWSLDPKILNSDTIIILIAENLSDINESVRLSPQLSNIKIPLPDETDRFEFINYLLKEMPEVKLESLTVDVLAKATSGLTRIHILNLFKESKASQAPISFKMISEKKKVMIENECSGLVEFVSPKYGLEAVAGMEKTKLSLQGVIKSIKEGKTQKVPMGLAFLGPMGTAKTFTATAFAGECGMTCLKFKNIYEKWVGASEGNLEKILNIAEALGFVVIVIDEIDRSLTSRSEGDSGTSSRIFARLKDFMSDTSHRGRVIFLVLSNRPDKVDPDIFRAGRIDKKIPFFFPETPEERKLILEKMLQKNKIEYEISDWGKMAQATEGYSGADLEAIVLLAGEFADDNGHPKVQPQDLEAAVEDYLPSRHEEMIEYMTLLAVFHCSSKRLLPDKLAQMSPSELNRRLEILRMKLSL